MKQVLSILVVSALLMVFPALSTASDRQREVTGFLNHRSETVFESGRYERHEGGRQHVKHQRPQAEKVMRKEIRRHKHDKKFDRYDHKSPRQWRNEHRHYGETRIIYRDAPRRTVVRERVVVSPVLPLLLPPSLVFHFSW